MDSNEVTKRAGISHRNLDYWVRCGYVGAEHHITGTGHSREFTAAEVRHVILMANLVRAGVRPVAASTMAAELIVYGVTKVGDYVLTQELGD